MQRDDDILKDFAADEAFLRQAMAEAARAVDKGDVPVGAVVVKDGRVLGRGHNQVEQLGDPTAHAEILALGAAADALGDWRLEGCTLYVTLEPCTMCCGALMLSRIGRVVYGAPDPRAGAVVSTARLLTANPYNLDVQVVPGVLEAECAAQLLDFFRELRARDKARRSATRENGDSADGDADPDACG